MSLTTPYFKVTQDEETVRVEVRLERSVLGLGRAKDDEVLANAGVVVQGNVFGFRCVPYYLPLVFPEALAHTPAPALRVAEEADVVPEPSLVRVEVILHKQVVGTHFAGLDTLRASFFGDVVPPPLQVPQGHVGDMTTAPAGSQAGLSGPEDTARINRLLGEALARADLELVADAPDKQGGSSELAAREPAATPPASASFPEVRLPLIKEGIPSRCHERYVTASSSPTGLYLSHTLAPQDAQHVAASAEALEEDKWDEGWYLDNWADEEGEVAALLGAAALPTSPPGPSTMEGAAGTTLDDVSLGQVALLLVELLFAWCYDRIVEGEAGGSVESAWTIARLCRSLVHSCPPDATVAAFRAHQAPPQPPGQSPVASGTTPGVESSAWGTSVLATLRASYRRALCMPLYRSWALCERVRLTVASLLAGRGHDGHSDGSGLDAALQALRDVEEMLTSYDAGVAGDGGDAAMRAYARETVAPLVSWLQGHAQAPRLLTMLASLVASCAPTKAQVGGETWDLELLEAAALEALREEHADEHR